MSITPPPFPDPPLAAPGVVLRRWRAADAADALLGVRDPVVLRFTNVPPDQTASEVRDFVASRAAAWERGEELSFVIAAGDGGRLLGTVSLLRIDWDSRRAEVGYWLGEWARGRGAATAAVRLIARWALTTGAFERLELRIDTANSASLAVAQRAGFSHEGVLRSYEERLGSRRDVAISSLLRADV